MSKKWLLLIAVLVLVITGIDFYLQSGTIFLLDGIWYPISWSQYLTFLQESIRTRSIYRWLHEGLSMLLGYQLFSKLYIVGTLFLSGVLGAKLGQWGGQILGFSEREVRMMGLFGLVFMLINPVLYERMITQPGIYLAMLLLGFGFSCLLQDLELSQAKLVLKLQWRYYLWAGVFFAMSAMLSPHTLFMVLWIMLVFLLMFVRSRQTFFVLFLTGLITLLGNVNWIIGGFWGEGSVVVETLSTFNQANIDSFVTNGITPLSVEGTTVLLYGFWGESAGHFFLPDTMGFSRIFAGSILLFVAIVGMCRVWKGSKKLMFFFLFLWLGGWVFASGISSVCFGSLNQWLFDAIPGYIGLREPQKWIILPLLTMGFFLFVGLKNVRLWIDRLFLEVKSRIKESVFLFCFFLILFLWVPHVLLSFHGQLLVQDYPGDYHAYRQHLLTTKENRKTLILPWHSYLACDWTAGRVISNPLKAFLGHGEYLITSDNIEIGSLYTNSNSDQSEAIEHFVKMHDLGELRTYGIESLQIKNLLLERKIVIFLQTRIR